MSERLTIPVGLLVAREVVEQPWRDVRWRAIEVLASPSEGPACQVVSRGQSFVHYLMAPLSLHLDRREETDYRVNLANGDPAVYVGLAEGPGLEPPVRVTLLTLSPFLARGSTAHGSDTVDRVTMPGALVEIVERFLAKPPEAAVR
jgi:hypothetical protein